MSNNKITFYVLSSTGSPVKKATFSRSLLFFICFICLCLSLGVGYIFYDYYHLKQSSGIRHANLEKLQDMTNHQHQQILNQRKQLQIFAHRINTLKEKIICLNNFEKQIRVISNLENNSKDDNAIFGVGGSSPEDLSVEKDLEERHTSLIREMHDQMDQLDTAAEIQISAFESLIKGIDKQRNILACTPAITPAKGLVTSSFGYRTSPFTGQKEFHKGLDIAARTGTPIYATADGTVTFSGKRNSFLGNIIIVDHGYGYVTIYAHANKLLKKKGEKVKRGEIIAEIGSTGRTTGPHVHYEVRRHGVHVNPKKYILD